jgi:hypothetical protein
MILTAATLVLVLGILAYSNSLFNQESQNSEFSQGQTLMINFADGIDSISSRVGASTYVRFNTRASGPQFKAGLDGNMTVVVNIQSLGTTLVPLVNFVVNAVQFRGGPLVGTGPLSLLRGITNDTVINNQYPLGRVYTNQSSGAYVTLDFDRVGIVNLGYLNVSTGLMPTGNHSAFDYIDIVQITMFNLYFGSVSGGAKYMVATTTSVPVTYYRLNYTGSPAATYPLLVNVTSAAFTRSAYSDNRTLTITPGSVLDGDGASPLNESVSVVIELIQPNVRIDFLG